VTDIGMGEKRNFALLPVVAQSGFKNELQVVLECCGQRASARQRCVSANSVTRNKIPLASETNQGFMFGNPSWGAMLARAYQYMEIAPEQMYAPGLAILVISLAFNALGESLRIVLDPTMKDR
jgi:hypothetical protein